MDLETYITALRAESDRFAAAIGAAAPDAAIPTCPEWTIRELVHHQGEVHRWATAVVSNGVPKPSAIPKDYLGDLPADDELVAWFRDGIDRLVDTLSDAPSDLAAFTFLADPPAPVVFWARRQTHETEMHRIDAQSASNGIHDIDAALAADGIDELLTGFVPRPFTRLNSEAPATMQIAPIDSDGRWHVTISEVAPETRRGAADADCEVSGTSSDLYRALWNRGGTEPLRIDGDPAVLDLFRDSIKIRWS